MQPWGTRSSGAATRAFEAMNRLGSAGTPFLFVIDYEMLRPLVYPLVDLERAGIGAVINGSHYGETPTRRLPQTIKLDVFPMPYERYFEAFQSLHRHFVLGNSYLANLTFPTRIETNLSLDQLFGLATARYKLKVCESFVCYSPESFVTIEGDTIASYPMKGTMDADLPNAEEILLADEKEKAEHVTIVDLIRNDIGMIARSVEVPRFRYIDLIESPSRRLLQVSSEIRGRLESGWRGHIGSIFAAMLPAGSICGAPKRKTVEIIAEAESGLRGYYTGVFGVFDGKGLSSGVMIRFVERREDGSLYYRSGGGLTVYAEPGREYQELLDKIYVPVAKQQPVGGRPEPQPVESRR